MTSNDNVDDLYSVRDRVRASLTTPVLLPEQRAAWIKSIRTYGERHWAFASNAYLSPIACARMGWECMGPDTLQCRSCRNTIKVHFSPKLKQPGIDKLSKEIATNQLFVRHDKLCPFFHIQHVTPDRVLPADSLTILKEFHDRHRQIVEEYSSMIEFETLRLVRVPDKLSHSQLGPATVLAICGWQPSKVFSNVLECAVCARGLSKPNDFPEFRIQKRARIDDNDLEVAEPIFAIGDGIGSRSTSPLPGQDLFGRRTSACSFAVLAIDPLGDHRVYCPWVKGSSAGIPPGWETCLLAVERERRTDSSEIENDRIDQSCRDILNNLRNLTKEKRSLLKRKPSKIS